MTIRNSKFTMLVFNCPIVDICFYPLFILFTLSLSYEAWFYYAVLVFSFRHLSFASTLALCEFEFLALIQNMAY